MFSGLSLNLLPIQASDKNPELSILKSNLETNGLLYVTENNVSPSNTINYNQEDVTTKTISLKGKNIDQLDSSKYKNIVVDVTELANENILSKIKDSFNKGARIVLRSDNIKLSDAYRLMGEKMDPQYFSEVDSANDQLTTVAISMFKNSAGVIHPAILNVELNNESEVSRVEIIALRDDNNPAGLFKNNQQQAFIQTIKPAYANLTTNWPYVNTYASMIRGHL